MFYDALHQYMGDQLQSKTLHTAKALPVSQKEQTRRYKAMKANTLM